MWCGSDYLFVRSLHDDFAQKTEEPGKRTSDGIAHVKDPPAAAQMAVSGRSRVPFQAVEWVETAFLNQAFRQTKGHRGVVGPLAGLEVEGSAAHPVVDLLE